MPDIRTSVTYLKKIPLYEREKPYCVCLSDDFKGPDFETHNLKFEDRVDIKITDVRGQEHLFELGTNGFEIGQHQSNALSFESSEDVIAYKMETEKFLKEKLGAQEAICYDVKVGNLANSILGS